MNQRWRGFAVVPILTFLLLWADLIRNLSAFWSTNPQYAYGWTVPFLSLFLLWECWITRPAPSMAHGRGLVLLVIAVVAMSLLPTSLLLEATPDWRFAHWALAGAVVGLSLGAFHLAGGRIWLVHFAFPVAFILIAVPWPVKVEMPFVGMLASWVSSLTVDGLNFCGVPAIQRGTVIEISTGLVGVEEACSGVRSFQATLMAALFLGQLWNFPLRSRSILLGAGVVFAFLCNVGRALILGLVAEKRGVEAIEKWHDPAGFTILGVCFAGLFGLALLLRPKFGRALAAAENLPPANPLPRGFVFGLAAWIVAVLAGTELWYRSAPAATMAWWRVEWPEQRGSFQEIPLTPAVREMKFDSGRQGRWREDDGSDWTMFYFRWLPGVATSRIVARWHNPDICLTAAGFKRVAEYDPLFIRKDGFELAFRTYRFDVRDRKTFVFFCVWEDRAAPGAVPEKWTPASRWRAVLRRNRKLGQQVLEVAISGAEDEKVAREAFEKRVTALLRPDSILPAEPGAPVKSAAVAP